MAYQIVCDVCEKAYTRSEWDQDPGIEALIPPSLLGDLEVDTNDFVFCSWECVARLALHYTGTEIAEDVLDEEREQEAEPPAAPPAPPSSEIGTYFPDGIKVDGREPKQHPALKRVAR